MKGFLATVGIFALVLGVIMANKMYLTTTSTALLRQAESLREEMPQDTDRIDRLQSVWQQNKDIMQISVTHKRIDTVTDLIDALRAYAVSRDEVEYKKTAALLINALEEIKRFEELSAVNIL